MKAIVKEGWSGKAALASRDFPTREPGRNEIRVAVKAASVNPADWKSAENPAAHIARRLLGRGAPTPVGLDFGGVVETVGRNVKDLFPGDVVAGIAVPVLAREGSYREKLIVPARLACKMPEGVDAVTAGALPVAGYTAWVAVKNIGKLKAGQRALVLGASGGVGHLAVQIAKHVCGGFVVGVCSSRNEKLVRDLGADEVVDYTKGDALDQAKAFGPYQVVVDCVGDYSGARCRALLGPGGRHVNVSPAGAGSIAQLVASPVKSRTLLGVPTGKQLLPLAEAIAADRVKVIISERVPLAEAQRAFELSQTGRTVGKIVLIP